jgi:hypothetical protein
MEGLDPAPPRWFPSAASLPSSVPCPLSLGRRPGGQIRVLDPSCLEAGLTLDGMRTDLAVLLAEVLWCVGGLHSESEILWSHARRVEDGSGCALGGGTVVHWWPAQ